MNHSHLNLLRRLFELGRMDHNETHQHDLDWIMIGLIVHLPKMYWHCLDYSNTIFANSFYLVCGAKRTCAGRMGVRKATI